MKKVLENLAKELEVYSHLPEVNHIQNTLQVALDADIPFVLDTIQGAERMLKIIKSGAYKDAELIERLKNTKDPLWHNAPVIDVDEEKVNALAQQFYRSNQKAPGTSTTFRISHIGKEVAEKVIAIFQKEGKSIDHIDIDESYFNATLLEGTGESGLAALSQHRLEKLLNVNKLVNIKQNMPGELQTLVSKDTNDLLDKFNKIGRELTGDGTLFYTLTIIPTPEDAKIDGMEYNEYVELFFEACDQPWEEIGKAQALLIKKLDNAKEVRIWNQDGTDIIADIDGMTFANSLVLKNIPGAEGFSSAKKNGINGKIVAKGNFKYGSSPIIKDPVLEIVAGKIISAYAADEGSTLALNKILDTDEGARYFGELAFGTNPHLRRQFLNGLLVEKVGGSFHVAVGAAYKYKTYDGIPVNLDNGNVSSIHRDITTLLRGQNSEVIVDGGVIQRNGQWLDPALRVLNEGWGAIEKEKQPKRWAEKYPNGYTMAA